MSGAFLNETPVANRPGNRLALSKSSYVATAAEAMKNYLQNKERLLRFPPNMTFPFPTILLFRSRVPT